MAFLIERLIVLRDDLVLFVIGSEIRDLARHFTVLYKTVRRLEETKLVDTCIDRERRNKTDVRTFGCFDRAKTTVMRVVNVANFEAGALTGKTARSESRHTTLVRHLRKRVSLVHELRELVRAEERVDHARDGTRIDEIGRTDLLIVDRHALADRTRHTRKTDVELLSELLANSAHTAIAQVIDIIDSGLTKLQANDVFQDLNDVFLRERRDLVRD